MPFVGTNALTELWAKAKNAFAPKSHTHNYAGSSSAGGAATSANKLATARTIALGTGATGTATSFDGSSNITIPVTRVSESYLTWGGKNFSYSYGPIDAAMVPELGANRLAFLKPAGIIVEYSRDKGATWADYGMQDWQKQALFAQGGSAVVGKRTNADPSDENDYLRITIDTDAAQVYTVLNKFVIYLTTNGSQNCTCSIDCSLEATPDVWVNIADNVPVSGWSGYNVINIAGTITYGNTKASQYGLIRLTFKTAGNNYKDTATKHSGLTVTRIMAFGGVGWTVPSQMAKHGHLYSYNENQEATFPAQVTAPNFNGPLSGNAATATKATQDGNGNNIASTYATKNYVADTFQPKGSYATTTQLDSLKNNVVVFDTEYTFANDTYTFTPKVWRNGTDITSTVAAAKFTWKMHDSSGQAVKTASGVKTFTVSKSEIHYVGSVVCECDL